MNSKVYYGSEILTLNETNLNHRIELEYYRTKKQKKYLFNKNRKIYGIEIIKKEYEGKNINIEKENVDRISNRKSKINFIIDKLKKYKVTPVSLKDIIYDILQK